MTKAPVEKKTMRDAFLAQILQMMDQGKDIFFLTADFGAPTLDIIRQKHPDRFVNVGIAEQNMVNVATGLALEGYTVYAYAIAPFITMRCYEQIRVNLAILSQLRDINVNLVGVGAGFSYEVSGPTHHCLEDLSIMRTLPNLKVISPSDWVMASQLPQYCFETKGPKYLRFDAKPQPAIYEKFDNQMINRGFSELYKGDSVCMISTGIMTQKALVVAEELKSKGKNIGLIDLFTVKGFDKTQLLEKIRPYKKIITMEEGFVGKGGLDSALAQIILEHNLPIKFKPMGLDDTYIFHIGQRESLHRQNNLDHGSLIREAAG